MTTEQNIRYRNILIEPINECAHYSPKFGHGRNGGFSLAEFQTCLSLLWTDGTDLV